MCIQMMLKYHIFYTCFLPILLLFHHFIGREFSSAGWVHGISEILKNKSSSAELVLQALVCCRLMSQRAEFMRSWTMFQLINWLCLLAKTNTRELLSIRLEARTTLRYATMNSPSMTTAMITLRIPNIDSIEAITKLPSTIQVLTEANDLSFGSTLLEQQRFTDETLNWIHSMFPAEVPYSILTTPLSLSSNVDNTWEDLFELAVQIITWLPKLCLSLVVTDVQDSKKREKTQISCDVASKQLIIIERIILHGLASGHPKAVSCAVRCLWTSSSEKSSSSNSENNSKNYDHNQSIMMALAIIESHSSGNGLLSCMDQLTASGTYIDTFLSLKLQFLIIRMISRIIKYCTPEVLNVLCASGIVRMIHKFFHSLLITIKDVPRLQQQTLFSKHYKEMIPTLRDIWSVLVGTGNSRLYEDILDLGIIQKIIQEWLPCVTSIFINTADPSYNPVVIKSEAIKILQTIIFDSNSSDRLIAELIRWIMVSNTITNEVLILKSENNKKGSMNAKRLAAEALAIIAAINAEVTNQELLDRGVPKYLLELTVHFKCYHVNIPSIWIKWGVNANSLSIHKLATIENDDDIVDNDDTIIIPTPKTIAVPQHFDALAFTQSIKNIDVPKGSSAASFLEDLQSSTGIPLSASTPQVQKKVKGNYVQHDG